MQIEEMRVADLIPYENNPRKNDEAVEAVAASIKEFGFKVPIIVDADNVIIAGHTRLKAAQLLGMETVPVIRADDLTDEQVKAFRLVDNKTAELAGWDFTALEAEMEELADFDMERFGFAVNSEDNSQGDAQKEEIYTSKTDIPHYELKGEKPNIADLFDCQKTDELISEIDQSSVTPAEKDFLRKAAMRHTVFNYKKIAEYYANSSLDMQILMENSALVLIDYNDAIMKGFVRLTKKMNDIVDGADKE